MKLLLQDVLGIIPLILLTMKPSYAKDHDIFAKIELLSLHSRTFVGYSTLTNRLFLSNKIIYARCIRHHPKVCWH